MFEKAPHEIVSLVIEGREINAALALVFAALGAVTALTSSLLGNSILSIVGFSSVPVDFLVAFSFLTRKPSIVPTFKNELLIPIVSFLMPLLLLNSVLVMPLTYSLSGGLLIAIIGMALTLVSLAYLRRSFAILPAFRKIVTGGPYRFIRHPMYLGEILYMMGMALLLLNAISITLFFAALVLFTMRMRMEEHKLMKDPQYSHYALDVPYRLIPGLF